jgi:hypothetical protein
VKLWAEKIRAQQPALVDPLIRRWIAQAEQYASV